MDAKLNLPDSAISLSRCDGERRLGKLDEEISVDIGGQEQVTRDFGPRPRRFPNRLPLLRAPTRLGKIDRRKAHGGAATGAQGHH
jgi:hypothetical protein